MGIVEVQKYRAAFISEARELLSRLSQALLAWEKHPRDQATLEECFRILHTLKGMAGAMGYEGMARLSHTMEETFSKAREGGLQPSPEIIDVLLRGADILETGVEDPEGRVTETDVKGILFKLGTAKAPVKKPKEKKSVRGAAPPQEPAASSEVKVTLSSESAFRGARALVVLKEAARFGRIARTVPEIQRVEQGEFERIFSIFVEGLGKPDLLRSRLEEIPEVEIVEISSEAEKAKPPVQSGTRMGEEARVPLARLDALMSLVGELIVARENLRRTSRDHRLFILEEPLARLTR